MQEDIVQMTHNILDRFDNPRLAPIKEKRSRSNILTRQSSTLGCGIRGIKTEGSDAGRDGAKTHNILDGLDNRRF